MGEGGEKQPGAERNKFFLCKSVVCKHCGASESPDPVVRARVFLSGPDENQNLKISAGAQWFSNSVVHSSNLWSFKTLQPRPHLQRQCLLVRGRPEHRYFLKFPGDSDDQPKLQGPDGCLSASPRPGWMIGGGKEAQSSKQLNLPVKIKLHFERRFHLSDVSGIFTAIFSAPCQAQDITESYGIAAVLVSRWVKWFWNIMFTEH